PHNPQTPPEQLNRMKPQLHRLMSVDFGTHADPVRHGRLQFAHPWAEAFEQAGRTLAGLAHEGHLTRGLRAVLAHHILFHWNRLGITAANQANLARVAREVVLDTCPRIPHPGAGDHRGPTSSVCPTRT